MNGVQKRSTWQLEFRKTDPIWLFGEGFKLRENHNFRNAGRHTILATERPRDQTPTTNPPLAIRAASRKMRVTSALGSQWCVKVGTDYVCLLQASKKRHLDFACLPKGVQGQALIFAPRPVRPAVRFSAAGGGGHCRQQRCAVKLTPSDYFGQWALSYRWHRTCSRTNRRHIPEWQVEVWYALRYRERLAGRSLTLPVYRAGVRGQLAVTLGCCPPASGEGGGGMSLLHSPQPVPPCSRLLCWPGPSGPCAVRPSATHAQSHMHWLGVLE